MESILSAVRKRGIPANPAVVISNRADAEGLKTARGLGVPAVAIPSEGFSGSRWDYDRKVVRALQKRGVSPTNGLVCLAGFMRIISPEFVKKYRNRILNVHPALLPSFPGLDSQRQAVDYGVRYSGCTVHFVDSGTDTGPIITQAVVGVKDGDTADTLAERILAEEHRIYPEAVDLFARKRIKLVGRRTVIV